VDARTRSWFTETMAKEGRHLVCGELEHHGDVRDSGAEPNLATAASTEEHGQRELMAGTARGAPVGMLVELWGDGGARAGRRNRTEIQ
jgi:hypothetical protein